MPRAALIPHPASPNSPAATIAVEYERRAGQLWLRFVCEGDPGLIRWPAEAPARRADNLWTHTCFEVFVGTGEAYREFNLSPSGQWASYAFAGYREGMRAADEAAVVDGLDGGSDCMALEARVDLPDAAQRLALSAVIEDSQGEKTYWALAHPSDKPDFHHPDSFTLVLPAPETAGTQQP